MMDKPFIVVLPITVNASLRTLIGLPSHITCASPRPRH